MNLQIINSCAGTYPRLPAAGTNPGPRYYFWRKVIKIQQIVHKITQSFVICITNTIYDSSERENNSGYCFI